MVHRRHQTSRETGLYPDSRRKSRGSKKPFIYEHYIDPDTPSTTLTHGPAIGLKIYQDYTVEFIAYADKKRTKEIDRLTQKIRSYVDTTGSKLKLFDGMKTKTADSLETHSAPPSGK